MDVDGVIVPDNGNLLSDRLSEVYGITESMTNSFFNDIFRECLVGKLDIVNLLPPYLEKWK